MNETENLLHAFYKAFSENDSETMMSCYHKNATFNDPVFIGLNAHQVKNMWKMLIERGKGDIKISYSDISADSDQGSAYWEADYKFSKSGRQVHNKINARFTFQDGKILTHNDDFDLKKWSGMALGFVGKIFGGTNWMQNKIRNQARASLEQYLNEKND